MCGGSSNSYMKRLRGKPCKGEYPGKKSRTFVVSYFINVKSQDLNTRTSSNYYTYFTLCARRKWTCLYKPSPSCGGQKRLWSYVRVSSHTTLLCVCVLVTKYNIRYLLYLRQLIPRSGIFSVVLVSCLHI